MWGIRAFVGAASELRWCATNSHCMCLCPFQTLACDRKEKKQSSTAVEHLLSFSICLSNPISSRPFASCLTSRKRGILLSETALLSLAIYSVHVHLKQPKWPDPLHLIPLLEAFGLSAPYWMTFSLLNCHLKSSKCGLLLSLPPKIGLSGL